MTDSIQVPSEFLQQQQQQQQSNACRSKPQLPTMVLKLPCAASAPQMRPLAPRPLLHEAHAAEQMPVTTSTLPRQVSGTEEQAHNEISGGKTYK
jgi:hypothetical protein